MTFSALFATEGAVDTFIVNESQPTTEDWDMPPQERKVESTSTERKKTRIKFCSTKYPAHCEKGTADSPRLVQLHEALFSLPSPIHPTRGPLLHLEPSDNRRAVLSPARPISVHSAGLFRYLPQAELDQPIIQTGHQTTAAQLLQHTAPESKAPPPSVSPLAKQTASAVLLP